MKKIILLFSIIFLGTANAQALDVLKSSPKATDASYDVQFLDTMIAHHRQGIEMAEMAVKKSQNTAIKNKAHMIIERQQNEVMKLQSIRDSIAPNAEVAVNMNMKGMEDADLENLSNQNSKNFDEKFLKMSIKHNEGGVEMSKDAAKRAKNARVIEIAHSLSSSQVGEISELKEILNEMF